MGSGYINLPVTNPLSTLLTTKGDLVTYSTTVTRLGVGSNNTILTADSSQATGIKWAPLTLTVGGTFVSNSTAGNVFFDSGGIFSADNNKFFWDNINKRLLLGTNSYTDDSRLVSVGDAVNQVNNVNSASASSQYDVDGYSSTSAFAYKVYGLKNVSGLFYYSEIPAQTNTVDVNASTVTAPDVTSFSAVCNYSGTGYTADGSTRSYTIYAYNIANTGPTNVYSVTGSSSNDTDNNSSAPLSMSLSWANMSVAGYVIVRDSDGSYVDVGNVTSFNDDNTLFGLNFGFSNSPTSVAEQFGINVSWSDPGGTDGFLVTAYNTSAGYNYDYYYTPGAVTSFTDNTLISWQTPVPSLPFAIYEDAESAYGNVNIQGKIIIEDQPSGSGNILLSTPGNASPDPTGINNICIGTYAVSASGGVNVSIGHLTTCYGIYSIAIGYSASVFSTQTGSVAIGHTAIADGDQSLALGYTPSAYGDSSVALGYACATGSSASNSLSVGASNTANAANTTAVGNSVFVSGTSGVGIGTSINVTHSGAISIGTGVTSIASNDFSFGNGASGGATTIDFRPIGRTTSTGASEREMAVTNYQFTTTSNSTRTSRITNYAIVDGTRTEYLRAQGVQGSATVLLSLPEGINLAVGTSTGTKIGTATSQKLGFYNATPVVQQTTGVATSTFVANTSGIVDDSATFGGYKISQIVQALKVYGLLA